MSAQSSREEEVMAGRKHGLRIPSSVLMFMEGTESYMKAEEPYKPDEDLEVTVLRHVRSLGRRNDGAVWVTGLTAAELDEIAQTAQAMADVSDLSGPEQPGAIRSARTVVAHCEALKETAPTESSIIPAATPEPESEPVEAHPLVELLRLAKQSASEAHNAAVHAADLRAEIHRQRNAEIIRMATVNPDLTNEFLGAMFDLDPSQVSRIRAGNAGPKD